MTDRPKRSLRLRARRDPGPSSSWVWLSVLLGSAGVVHLVRPATFDGIVPEWLPGSARSYTYVSGVAELALALGLAIPQTRRLTGGSAALFFLAVFPANVKMALDTLAHPRATTARKVAVIARLPLQIPLVTAALKARGRRPA
ncbi:MAG: hypothetical protein ABWX96_07985 [Propionibacteriaceae bacterium]